MRILLIANNTIKICLARFINMPTAFASETESSFFLQITLIGLLLGLLVLM